MWLKIKVVQKLEQYYPLDKSLWSGYKVYLGETNLLHYWVDSVICLSVNWGLFTEEVCIILGYG